MDEQALIVPPERLSPQAFDGLIEEFVTRDGTELSDMADKTRRVRRLLETGEAVILFDPQEETCQIHLKRELGRGG